jgi:hypothetical protein
LFTGIFTALLLSSTVASPYKRATVGRTHNANNFVGEGTNELATAILQVLHLSSKCFWGYVFHIDALGRPKTWEIIINMGLLHPNYEDGKFIELLC